MSEAPDRKETSRAKREPSVNAADLSVAALELVESTDVDSVFEAVGTFVSLACPGCIAVINEMLPDGETLRTRQVLGLPPAVLRRLETVVGFRVESKETPVDPRFLQLLTSGRLLEVAGGFREFVSAEIPALVSDAVVSLTGLSAAHTIGIADGVRAVGCVHIFTRGEEPCLDRHLLESFTRHAFTAIARLEAENQLNARADANLMVLHHMTEGLARFAVILGPDGVPADFRFIEANPAFGTVTGLDPESLAGRSLRETLTGLDEGFLERCFAVVESGRPDRIELELAAQHRHLSVGAYSPAKGELVTVMTDVTQAHDARVALAASVDEFRYLFEHSAIPKSLTTPDGAMTVNQAFLDLLGYDQADFEAGLTWRDFTHPDDVADSEVVVAEMLAGVRDGARFVKRYVRPDGSLVWADIYTRLRVDASGRPLYFVTSAVDVSERLNAERALIRLNEELEQRVQQRTEELQVANEQLTESNELLQAATRARSDFTAAMSHELRTPLNAIIGFSSLLYNQAAGPLNPEQRKQLGIISRAGKHLLSLVNDVLNLARIESEGEHLERAPCDPGPVLAGVVEMITPLADSKGIELRLVDELSGEQVESDARALSQIITNLVGNAVKFTDAGTVSVTARFVSQQLVITVKDTGRGISADELPHVMEAFYQAAPAPGEAKNEGAGLGLSVSQRLAEALGGRLECASTLGEGSTFVLSLPRGSASGT